MTANGRTKTTLVIDGPDFDVEVRREGMAHNVIVRVGASWVEIATTPSGARHWRSALVRIADTINAYMAAESSQSITVGDSVRLNGKGIAGVVLALDATDDTAEITWSHNGCTSWTHLSRLTKVPA